MGTGASVLALNPTRRLEMAMDVAYRRQAPPYVAPQPKHQPDYTRGVPRSRWVSLEEITPNTTDIDLSVRLYRNVNYMFTPLGRAAQVAFWDYPFRIIGLLGQLGGTLRFLVEYTIAGTTITTRFPITDFGKIVFHSR